VSSMVSYLTITASTIGAAARELDRGCQRSAGESRGELLVLMRHHWKWLQIPPPRRRRSTLAGAGAAACGAADPTPAGDDGLRGNASVLTKGMNPVGRLA
jgi:hypothetical protein